MLCNSEYDSFSPHYNYGALRSNKQFREHIDTEELTRSRSPPLSAADMEVGPDGQLKNLRELIALLQTPAGLKLYKTAYRTNMQYKIERYGELLEVADREVDKAIEIMQIKIPELKHLANIRDDNDNWNIFQSVSERYEQAKEKSAVFQAIIERAKEQLSGSMALEQVLTNDIIKGLRDKLILALKQLTNYSYSQPKLVRKVVDITGSFLKDPKLFRKKMLNIMLLGGAGTGKTTIAGVIGKVFGCSGIFVSGEVIEAGRAELVGQYEGQTVARTRNFLISNLDNGVIFIDEAYAITPWDKGKPEGYGSEAATAMVEFMTQFQGLYCIIVAGYETPMVRYFLGTNEGLNRRFPNKFLLQDLNSDDLIVVFKRKLLEFQGLPLPDGKDVVYESSSYFSDDAWKYLADLIRISSSGETFLTEEEDDSTRKKYTNVKKFLPQYPLVYNTLFANQAGSMTNLADEAVQLLLTQITYDDVIRSLTKGASRPSIRQQGLSVMKSIVEQRIQTSALSLAHEVLQELHEIERVRR